MPYIYKYTHVYMCIYTYVHTSTYAYMRLLMYVDLCEHIAYTFTSTCGACPKAVVCEFIQNYLQSITKMLSSNPSHAKAARKSCDGNCLVHLCWMLLWLVLSILSFFSCILRSKLASLQPVEQRCKPNESRVTAEHMPGQVRIQYPDSAANRSSTKCLTI